VDIRERERLIHRAFLEWKHHDFHALYLGKYACDVVSTERFLLVRDTSSLEPKHVRERQLCFLTVSPDLCPSASQNFHSNQADKVRVLRLFSEIGLHSSQVAAVYCGTTTSLLVSSSSCLRRSIGLSNNGMTYGSNVFQYAGGHVRSMTNERTWMGGLKATYDCSGDIPDSS
jgi:hypothetical protein